jgi:two-component system chemotaxis response regulator CheB
MLVDDSAIVRAMIQRALTADPGIEVVATASDGAMAIESLRRIPSDIIILDIEMPVMDGLTALPELLKASPKPRVIMASTLTMRNAEISMKAMELGATDYLAKPTAAAGNEAQDFYRQLIEKIHALAPGGSAPPSPAAPVPANPVAPVKAAPVSVQAVTATTSLAEALNTVPRAAAIAIASSTGGPQALLAVFTALKGRALNVPVFITQHMPPSFTTILAEHISRALGSDCHEGKDGEDVRPGIVYLAPGDFHMTVKNGPVPKIGLNQNPPENFCRPSADPMLRSLAAIYGKGLVTVVLTGMGSDGSQGAAEVVRQGGTVAAQNESTCVVYGMPRAVVEAKLAKAVLPLDQVAPWLARAMGAA